MKVELSLDDICLLEIACDDSLAVYAKQQARKNQQTNYQHFASRIKRVTAIKAKLTEHLKGIV